MTDHEIRTMAAEGQPINVPNGINLIYVGRSALPPVAFWHYAHLDVVERAYKTFCGWGQGKSLVPLVVVGVAALHSGEMCQGCLDVFEAAKP